MVKAYCAIAYILVAVLLCGCAESAVPQQPTAETAALPLQISEDAQADESAESTLEQTVPAYEEEALDDEKEAPEPLTIERAAEIYSRFLEDEIPAYSESGYEFWVASIWDLRYLKDRFYTRDLTGDGIPELYLDVPGPHGGIWGIESGEVVKIRYWGTYYTLLANGGVFYYRPRYDRDVYRYEGYSPESKVVPDISLTHTLEPLPFSVISMEME